MHGHTPAAGTSWNIVNVPAQRFTTIIIIDHTCSILHVIDNMIHMQLKSVTMPSLQNKMY